MAVLANNISNSGNCSDLVSRNNNVRHNVAHDQVQLKGGASWGITNEDKRLSTAGTVLAFQSR